MNSRRAARDTSYTADGTYVPPPKEECDPIEPPIPVMLNDEGTSRMVTAMRFKEGRLVSYAVLQEVLGNDGSWHEVAKIDCCHSQVHRHTVDLAQPESDHRKVIRELYSQDDVIASWDASYSEIEHNWEEKERAFKNGDKKQRR